MTSHPVNPRALGQLEERIMAIIWGRATGMSVRDVGRALDASHASAYTTVMTTLDRLYKKGLLERRKEGMAFVYKAALTRDEYHRRLVEVTVTGLVARSSSADPVLSAFIDAAASVDEANLRRIEELVAERRRKGQ